MGLVDGLPSLEIRATTISGTTLQASTAAFGASEIGNAELADNSASGAKVDPTFPTASLGSTRRFGAFIQAGSVATAAGSGGTIEFGVQFANTGYWLTLSPANFVTGAGSVVPYVSGTRNRSGCEIVGAASTTYEFIAIGSGRV